MKNQLRPFASLLLALCWGLSSGYGQEVLNISASTHSRNGSVSSWTVPSGGPYKVRITARGAKGGGGNDGNNPRAFTSGGAGAILSGEFIVSSGQVLEANAGAPGQDFSFSGGGGGGGGASGVRIQGGGTLVIAGGGGAGSGAFGNENGNAALVSSSSDQGGSAPDGSGGGGLSTPGANGTRSTGGGAGYNATGGGSGGSGGGGFGAGGAGNYGGGGGGGYSGGSGGGVFSNRGGGGGGSYNQGSNQSNLVGNTGGGQVIIEILSVDPLSATTLSPTQPVCATPTQGSVSIDPTYQSSVSDLEYAIVSGNAFAGTPTFTTVPSDPFTLSSGFGTIADADGEIYTLRLRLKANTGVYVDRTYTLTSVGTPATRLYVDASKTAGANTGLTWTDALTTLQAALNYPCSTNLTEIWVAKGTYYPTADPTGNLSPANPRTKTFVLKNGITIYGGFPNTGNPGMGQRNWTANPTILSGDIDGTPDVVSGSGSTLAITGNGGNAYHVIYNNNNGLTTSAVLDGFTISGGNANAGSGAPHTQGGGIYNNNSSPTISHCIFSNNVALSTGGGLFTTPATTNLNMSNCFFNLNMAGEGGGIFNRSLLVLNNCQVTNNRATSGQGGGMYNSAGTLSMTGCQVTGNDAGLNFGGGIFSFRPLTLSSCQINNNSAGNGGGIFIANQPLIMTNCEVKNNKTAYQGSGINLQDVASATLTNCNISGNVSQTSQGGIANLTYNSTSSQLTLINCTVANNTSVGGYRAIWTTINSNGQSATTLLKNTIVANNPGGNFLQENIEIGMPTFLGIITSQGNNLDSDGTSGLTNGVNGDLVNINPLFVSATDVHLKSCSPAINVGNNAANSTPKDLDNNTRKVGVIDLGAYEYQGQPFGVVASTAGNCASITLSTKITSGTPAYAYSWAATSGGNFTSSSSSPTAFTINNNPGNYAFTVTVNDGVGCTATATTSTALLNPTTQGTLSSNSPVTVGLVIDLKTSIFGGGYTWKGPDAWTSNLKDPSRGNAKLTMAGVYTLTVKGSNACTGTNTISVQVVPKSTREAAVEAENIERQAIDMEISAYPNPVTNTLTVEVRLAKPAALTLELLNGLGEKNGQWKLTEESTFHKTEIDMTSLTGGMYLLQAQAGKQKVVKRVVKIQY